MAPLCDSTAGGVSERPVRGNERGALLDNLSTYRKEALNDVTKIAL